MFSKIINLLNCVVNLVLRIMDWRRDTKPVRERDEVRRAVAEHDAKALNTIIQIRRDKDRD